MKEGKVTVRALILGTVVSGLFALLTVYFENRHGIYVTSTQIPVLPYVLLFACVLLINPLCRLLGFVRTFTVTEILLVFVMGMVSAGVSTYGMASQLVPLIGNLSNSHWNSDSSRWDLHVEPYVNEAYFICEPGTSRAAGRLLKAHTQWSETRGAWRAARCLKLRQDELATVRATLEEAGKIADQEERLQARQIRRHGRALAEKSLENARKWWANYSEQHDVQEALATYPARIETLREEVSRRKAELDAIKEAAFEKVAVFRRGLPKEMRAIPGLVYAPGEGLAGYLDRARRLTHGTSALADLRKADDVLAEAIRSGGSANSEAAAHIRSAVDKLAPVSRIAGLTARKQELARRIEAARDQRHREQRGVALLHRRRRYTAADEANRLEGGIKAANSVIAELDADIRSLEAEHDEIVFSRLAVARRVHETRLALANIGTCLERGTAGPYPEVQRRLWDQMDRFRGFDASLPRFLAGDVPWPQWLGPLVRWGVIIGLTYVVFMTLNVLIFRQWAHNERLVYPLAKLPELLAGADGSGKESGLIAPLFRSGLFWVGFGISATVLGWNILCSTQLVPGLKWIPLDIMWYPYIQNSMFRGLGWHQKFTIFFTMIGLSFMIPARISFSLWFFWILGMFQLLVLVWLGYGVSEGSFSADGWWTFNFRTAEGSGALMVFAAVILFKCRWYILCFFAPGAVRDLAAAERAELRFSSFLFLFGSAGLVLLLWRSLGVNPVYAVFCYIALLAISIGLARAVAEGGILGVQAWTGPFHFIRTLFGMHRGWTAPALYAPLMIYHAIMFQDMRTFIVPSMANSLKIGNDMKMGRVRFHLSIFLGIVAAGAVAVTAHVAMAYNKGEDSMDTWFSSMPKAVFDQVARMVETQPVDTTACVWWLLFGAGLMVALLYLRRFVFWLPHPIGLIMLVNPVMRRYWFSLFLGWAFKSLVSKYGNKDQYGRIRGLFVGLIVGEILLVLISMILSYAFGFNAGIDLNRG